MDATYCHKCFLKKHNQPF
ncbi:zinc-finger domain-containing protein [Flavobacterium sp. GP15]